MHYQHIDRKQHAVDELHGKTEGNDLVSSRSAVSNAYSESTVTSNLARDKNWQLGARNINKSK
jgi:hypothetical protein